MTAEQEFRRAKKGKVAAKKRVCGDFATKIQNQARLLPRLWCFYTLIQHRDVQALKCWTKGACH